MNLNYCALYLPFWASVKTVIGKRKVKNSNMLFGKMGLLVCIVNATDCFLHISFPEELSPGYFGTVNSIYEKALLFFPTAKLYSLTYCYLDHHNFYTSRCYIYHNASNQSHYGTN